VLPTAQNFFWRNNWTEFCFQQYTTATTKYMRTGVAMVVQVNIGYN
jgi:hypothetical protein